MQIPPVAAVLPLVLLASSCASHLNRASAIRYTRRGAEALARNHLLVALEHYRRALVNVELAGMGPDVRSTAHYNLARVTGALCQHQEAEHLLRISLQDLESLEPSEATMTYRCKRLFTLGDLACDRGRHQDAAAYYGRAISLADQLAAGEKEPMRYAEALDRYAEALGHAGQAAAAAAASQRAAGVRRAHPGAEPSRGRLRFDGFENAAEQLLADLRRAEAVEGAKGPTATIRLLWLGVLESNRGNHQAALTFFERGFQNMAAPASGGESMAIIMDRHAHVLRALGRDEEARAIEARAATLRSAAEKTTLPESLPRRS